MKTRDKIVYAALELFNQHGERNITTNHIADYIEISPGNLYYHFRNKQEIVREIFALYSAELLERFTPIQGSQESLTMLKSYLDSIFTLMWKYRFSTRTFQKSFLETSNFMMNTLMFKRSCKPTSLQSCKSLCL